MAALPLSSWSWGVELFSIALKLGFGIDCLVHDPRNLFRPLANDGQDRIREARVAAILRNGEGLDSVRADDGGDFFIVHAPAYHGQGRGANRIPSIFVRLTNLTWADRRLYYRKCLPTPMCVCPPQGTEECSLRTGAYGKGCRVQNLPYKGAFLSLMQFLEMASTNKQGPLVLH